MAAARTSFCRVFVVAGGHRPLVQRRGSLSTLAPALLRRAKPHATCLSFAFQGRSMAPFLTQSFPPSASSNIFRSLVPRSCFCPPSRFLSTEMRYRAELLTPKVMEYVQYVVDEHNRTSDIVAKGELKGDEFEKSMRQMAEWAPLVHASKELSDAKNELKTIEGFLNDPDAAMQELAKEQHAEQSEVVAEAVQNLLGILLEEDDSQSSSLILELRAGTGGSEASLFVGDLLNMYRNYSTAQGWSFNVLNESESEVGGLKDVDVEISGENATRFLKTESGVHRVQRVPLTESQGRVHTSTAVVIVMPVSRKVEVKISDRDLKIETFRASGAGGQHVNKTDSAIRITHLPTNTVVSCQSERSQHQNKATAMRVLHARLQAVEDENRARERQESRQAQMGEKAADRSEKIRTYNFPQDRVTDHRISTKLNSLTSFMSGDIDTAVQALILYDQMKKLDSLTL